MSDVAWRGPRADASGRRGLPLGNAQQTCKLHALYLSDELKFMGVADETRVTGIDLFVEKAPTVDIPGFQVSQFVPQPRLDDAGCG